MGKQFTSHIRNWSEYNKALVQRGSITLWFSNEAIKAWRETNRTGKKGRPKTYSDEAILSMLMIRAIFHLPLRSMQGFLLSLVAMLSLSLPIPCYTRVCRRARSLGQQLKKLSSGRPTDVVIDSTGVKVYGEGEWKVRQHGKSKRRTWRKIHLSVCPKSHEIILSELTESKISDATIANKMASHLPKSVKRGYGDGAYDQEGCYESFQKQGVSLIVPPRRGGCLRDLAKMPHLKERNNALLVMKGLGGDDEARKLWKILSGYHTRSLAETAMYRFKCIFGGNFRSRILPTQRAELYAKSLVINRLTRLGMPVSSRKTA
jgi:hypothetical protein